MSGVLALIPARGQSKGIPRKNIRDLAGKPLIVWTIEAALAARGIDSVVVTTDDEEIAEIARAAGAEVPFLRPGDLATDGAPGIAPVMHALEMLPDATSLLLLQPTSPLRGTSDIEGLLAMVEATKSESVVSVCAVAEHPAWMFARSMEGRLTPFLESPSAARRQDLEPLYVLNGAMYYAQRDWLMSHRALTGSGTLGYVMPDDRSLDIDTPFDLRLAEILLMTCSA